MDAEFFELSRRAARLESLLRELANRQRLQILCLLGEGERNVSALNAELDLSQSALSQHLARLRSARVVVARREGQNIYYCLRDPRLLGALAALCEVGDALSEEQA